MKSLLIHYLLNQEAFKNNNLFFRAIWSNNTYKQLYVWVITLVYYHLVTYICSVSEQHNKNEKQTLFTQNLYFYPINLYL